MACPRIAGIALLWIAAHPEIPKLERPVRFAEALKLACDHPANRDTKTGYGKPDTSKLTGTIPPPVVPPVIPPPVTPGDPSKITLTEASLTPEARKQLSDAGVTKFTLSLEVAKATVPVPAPILWPAPPTDPPSVDHEWKFQPGRGWGWGKRNMETPQKK